MSEQTKQRSKVVEILGKMYPLDAEMDDLELQSLVSFVKEHIEAAGATHSEPTTSRQAVIACLNIADKYFSLKTTYENLNELVSKKSAELGSEIDKALLTTLPDKKKAQ
jgi:cell division protein ZapA (FtsZ GTPase activity inhibitor)